MKRFPAFDPPEYVGFRPDPKVTAEYSATLRRDPKRRALVERLPRAEHLRLYEGMVRFRLHDITLKRWVRQGVISKAWLGTGEEAVAVGTTRALRPGDFVGPMIRNAGSCHEMGMPVAQMLKAYLGTHDQITRGRDLHTGDPEKGVIPPTSFMAALVPVFTGIALAAKQRKEPRVALTYVGDGASRTAAFHEGFNFAAVQRVPLVIVLQDNQVALGTATPRHTAAPMEIQHTAYGVEGLSCDGNNVLDTWAASRLLVDRCRKGDGPFILTARTFRMGGHATHDEAEARALFPPETFAHFGQRDPIGTYEAWLVAAGPALDGRKHRSDVARREANEAALAEAERRVTAEIEAAEAEALRSRKEKMPPPEDAVTGVYAVTTSPATKRGNGRGTATTKRAAPRSKPRKTVAAHARRTMASRGGRRLS
ncbi:MAG TPA: thiamine pyrophosphate-dependent dehydrogenase E1 component subunit alpha [Candidatus Polarisedimenticolia bacterium]|nr:thiamine pyrophosphate-dependent dehydrogenase E1 component subunit alpha [Candidatus Polarisedimenticolia bacterium]